MGCNLLGQSTEDLARYVGENGASPARDGGEARQARGQRATASLHRTCARVADCIRSSTEMMGRAAGREQRARGVPWLGLLLWVFACAALFVSLMMRPGDLDRDRRVAASSEAGAYSWIPVRSWTRPTSELSLFTVRRPPSR